MLKKEGISFKLPKYWLIYLFYIFLLFSINIFSTFYIFVVTENLHLKYLSMLLNSFNVY